MMHASILRTRTPPRSESPRLCAETEAILPQLGSFSRYHSGTGGHMAHWNTLVVDTLRFRASLSPFRRAVRRAMWCVVPVSRVSDPSAQGFRTARSGQRHPSHSFWQPFFGTVCVCGLLSCRSSCTRAHWHSTWEAPSRPARRTQGQPAPAGRTSELQFPRARTLNRTSSRAGRQAQIAHGGVSLLYRVYR